MILVTGGTGLVGKHLVRFLVEKGRPVRCLVRSKQKATQLLPQQVELLEGKINDPVVLKRACKGVRNVIHLVAVIREQGQQTFEHINVEGTLNLVVAANSAGVERFIHMSVLGVEDNPRYRYIYSKWQGEEAVRQSGLNWTILRPSLIYGDGFNFFHRMLQSIKLFPGPFVPVPGKGDTLFQPIAVQDVVRCLGFICDQPATQGEIIEIGGPQQLSYEQMLDLLLAHLGLKRRKIHIPLFLMHLVVPLWESIFRDPPVTAVELKQLEVHNITDVGAVKKYFGFSPLALQQGMKYIIPPAN